MKLFGKKVKKNTATQSKSSAPLGDNDSLPPPQNPNYVTKETEFEGRLECSINHDLGRIDIIVLHEEGDNKINVLNDFLERLLNQVTSLINNNVNATIKSIDILVNVEFNLSKSIREKLSRLNRETYGAITFNSLLYGPDVEKMSLSSQNRLIEIVADIESADVFKAIPETKEKFDAICKIKKIKITMGGSIWSAVFNPVNSNDKSAPKPPIKSNNSLTKTT
jgi:hypothetical protein